MFLKDLHNLVEKGLMMINRQTNLQNLALQVLNQCPNDITVKIENGYIDLVVLYFEEIASYSDLFAPEVKRYPS